MRPSQRAGWIASAGIALLLVAVFFASCERREIEIPRGYAGEAARNRYLAAQRMLERMNVPVQSFALPGAFLANAPADGTILLPTARRTLTPERSEALLRFAEQGGNLVLVTWQLWDDANRAPDPILDKLGVMQFQNAEPDPDDEDDAAEEDDAEAQGAAENGDAATPHADAEPEADEETGEERAADAEPDLALLELPDRAEPLGAEFDRRFRLELEPSARANLVHELSDVNGTHLVTLRTGQGFVTALTDDFFLTHPRIGDWDHAELVYRLARLGGRTGPVWIVYGDEFPSIWALVAQHGWMALASALALLVLWLWSVSRRFGPLAPDPTRERRELMEHVRAAGRLQWRHGAGRALLTAVRDALLARVRERHPALAELDPHEQSERLAQLSDLPPQRVHAALAFQTDTDASRFPQDVAILEKIRRSL